MVMTKRFNTLLKLPFIFNKVKQNQIYLMVK
jgi:hypothetical protein